MQRFHAWKKNRRCKLSTETDVRKLQNGRKEIERGICDLVLIEHRNYFIHSLACKHTSARWRYKVMTKSY